MKKNKKGIIVVNSTLRIPKFTEHIEEYKKSFAALGVDLTDINHDEIVETVSGGCAGGLRNDRKSGAGEELCYAPAFVLFWDKDIRLAYNLERHTPVFNGARCIEICDDKALSQYVLARAGVPCPPAVFAPKYFKAGDLPPENYIDKVIVALGLPLIVKDACGSFGQGVYLAESKSAVYEILKKTSGAYLFQKFIAESAGRDIRVYVSGGKVAGAVLRENKNGFISNASAGGVMTPYKPTKEEERLSVAAADAVGSLFCGVDILLGKDAPLVCEVNSNAHFMNFKRVTGINFADITAGAVYERVYNLQ